MKPDFFRPGTKAPEHPPLPLILNRKTTKKYHILVGHDWPQVRFAERFLGMPVLPLEKVDDMTLLSEGAAHILQVELTSTVDISNSMRDKVSFWTIDSITGHGSVAASAIVRYAASLLGKELDKEAVQKYSDELTKAEIEDIPSAIWRAVWLLLGPVPPEYKRWLEPWENNVRWLQEDIDPKYRINSIFKDLSVYSFLISGEEESIKKAGIVVSPSRLKYIKGLKLDFNKVYETIREISAWRMKRQDPYICALKISGIWA